MALMQWLGTFFSLDWMDASAAIFSIMALGAGLVSLWRRLGDGAAFERYAEAAEEPMAPQRRVA